MSYGDGDYYIGNNGDGGYDHGSDNGDDRLSKSIPKYESIFRRNINQAMKQCMADFDAMGAVSTLYSHHFLDSTFSSMRV